MLETKNLSVQIQDKEIIHNVSLSFQKGKNYCLLGKNGSWKSSLAMTIMWHHDYSILKWDISINGKSILKLDAHQRAQKWIFLAFQTIPEIKGVKLFEFLRSIYSAKTWIEQTFLKFKRHIVPLMEELHIDPEFLRRDLNVWFSGGERRKIEILQLKLLDPTYIFLDEIDSGLDVDAFKAVAELIKKTNTKENTFIIITHYFTILDHIPIDEVHVLEDGKIKESGWSDIIENIKRKWFTS